MATAPSIEMGSASKYYSMSDDTVSPMDIDNDMVLFEKNFCSGEGCFIEKDRMYKNLSKLTEDMIDSIVPLSIYFEYSTSKFSISLDLLKQLFKNYIVASKIFYKEPTNLNIITDLYNAIGDDMNTMTTYIVSDINKIPKCYGFKIIMKNPFKIMLKNHKGNEFYLSTAYAIFQYPCQTDIFKIIKDASVPSGTQRTSISLQNNFVKYAPKLFTDLIKFHKHNFILYDIKLENIVYCGKDTDLRHIDFSFGITTYDNWTKGIPDRLFRTYYIEPVNIIMDIQDTILRNFDSFKSNSQILQSNYDLFKIILKLNDVYVLLYSWLLTYNYKKAKEFEHDNSIDLSILGYIRTALKLDRLATQFILNYIYELKEELEKVTHHVQQTFKNPLQNTELKNLLNGLIYSLNYYLTGVIPGGGSKLNQFINTYKNTYFISEALTQQPYVNNIVYIYRINNIIYSYNRTLSVSRYKLDLVKNPSMSLKNLKGQKEEAYLSKGNLPKIVLKKNKEILIPIN